MIRTLHIYSFAFITLGSMLRCIALMRSALKASIWYKPIRGTTSLPNTTDVVNVLEYSTAGMLESNRTIRIYENN